MKLSSVNTIHVKQHNVGFFIFKFALHYMLSNVYINRIHAGQCLYTIVLYCREGFSHPFSHFLSCIQRNLSHLISKHLGRRFFNGATSNRFPYLLCKQKNILFQLINKSLVFNLIAIKQKILAFIVLYICRSSTQLFFLSLFLSSKVKKIHCSELIAERYN